MYKFLVYILSGWWFGTFFIFPYIGNNHPNWLIFFRGVETTIQLCFIHLEGTSNFGVHSLWTSPPIVTWPSEARSPSDTSARRRRLRKLRKLRTLCGHGGGHRNCWPHPILYHTYIRYIYIYIMYIYITYIYIYLPIYILLYYVLTIAHYIYIYISSKSCEISVPSSRTDPEVDLGVSFHPKVWFACFLANICKEWVIHIKIWMT